MGEHRVSVNWRALGYDDGCVHEQVTRLDLEMESM